MPQESILPTAWAGGPVQLEQRAGASVFVWNDDEGYRVAIGPGSLKPGRALSSMLDEFCALSWPGRGSGRRLVDFVDRYGPWGRCECGTVHGPLDRNMRPVDLPRPPGEFTEDPVDIWLSAHRLNALRAITAFCRASVAPDPELELVEALYAGRSGRQPLVETPEAAAALVDEWAAAWLRATHVTPALSPWSAEAAPVLMRVRGVAGALAVAFLAERRRKPETAICHKCGVTRTVLRGFDLADDPAADLCRSCRGKGRPRRPLAAH